MIEHETSCLLALIEKALEEAKEVAKQLARGTGAREVALTITKLEEARHRVIDAQGLIDAS